MRAIGMSNFKPAHLDRLIAETGVTPDVNQIQLNPRLGRVETRAYNAEHGIVTESWSPLGAGSDLLAEPIIVSLAERYARTPGTDRPALAHRTRPGDDPEVVEPERLRANIDIFDFSLSADDVEAISSLDQGEDAATDSDKAGH